jgi:tRNA(Arg) A34 adenosine deaminase TadA
MARAIQLAIENVQAGKGGPFAAVVVRQGSIIAAGVNLVTSTNDPTAHAEIVAIRQACRILSSFQLSGCEIYASSEPCPMCMGAIYWARLARVFCAATRQDAAAAGFDDAHISEQLQRPVSRRIIPMRQMMREEALAAFQAWDQRPDKIRY